MTCARLTNGVCCVAHDGDHELIHETSQPTPPRHAPRCTCRLRTAGPSAAGLCGKRCAAHRAGVVALQPWADAAVVEAVSTWSDSPVLILPGCLKTDGTLYSCQTDLPSWPDWPQVRSSPACHTTHLLFTADLSHPSHTIPFFYSFPYSCSPFCCWSHWESC